MQERHPDIAMLRHKLSHFSETVPEDEYDALAAVFGPPVFVERGESFVVQNSRPTRCSLLLSGFAGRSVLLRGGDEQTTAIHVAGDFVDLHALLLNSLDHRIVALTPCQIATANRRSLEQLIAAYPKLSRALWFLTVVDAAVHRRWLTVLGRRSALGRCAHLVCEMHARLDDVGLVDNGRFRLPLSQARIGDMLALSAVHINRVIQDLRSSGLLTWERGTVTILDFDGLAAVGEFEPSYLQISPRPRVDAGHGRRSVLTAIA
ncbi:Crp/Fnr family transcriptional regulator [Phenylobacterium immobile]|uniref:Crp/Fnr family transcriptional regulator n=1 Tax=Phenylobacterium immobile TaxID=21 RepID=UPI000AAEEA14|nr:Crp/Fnr family transcriptional regulator [Phenylobacterium immobile]